MTDWEVAVRTESNYIKKVRVDDCVTRSDAEAAALGMTGGKEIVYSTPKSYNDERVDNDKSFGSSESNVSIEGIILLFGIFLVIAYWQYVLAFSLICVLIWYFLIRKD